jgi:hypothetical protein
LKLPHDKWRNKVRFNPHHAITAIKENVLNSQWLQNNLH